jgi:hypothetical protein
MKKDCKCTRIIIVRRLIFFGRLKSLILSIDRRQTSDEHLLWFQSIEQKSKCNNTMKLLLMVWLNFKCSVIFSIDLGITQCLKSKFHKITR